MILMIITIQNYQEALIFNIVKMIIYNIILKMPWLKLHKPNINWKKKFTFKKCNCVINLKFIHRQRSMANKKQTALNQSLCSTKKLIQKKQLFRQSLSRIWWDKKLKRIKKLTHFQILKDQVSQRIEFRKYQNDRRRQKTYLTNTIIENISFEKSQTQARYLSINHKIIKLNLYQKSNLRSNSYMHF